MDVSYLMVYNHLIEKIARGDLTIPNIFDYFPTLKISERIHRLFYIVSYGWVFQNITYDRQIPESIKNWNELYECSLVYTGFLILTLNDWLSKFYKRLEILKFKIQNTLEGLIKDFNKIMKKKNEESGTFKKN